MVVCPKQGDCALPVPKSPQDPPTASTSNLDSTNDASALPTIFAEFCNGGFPSSSTTTVCSLKPPEEQEIVQQDVSYSSEISEPILLNISVCSPVENFKGTVPETRIVSPSSPPDASLSRCIKYIPTSHLTPQLILRNLDDFDSSRLKEICVLLNLPKKSGKTAKIKNAIRVALSSISD